MGRFDENGIVAEPKEEALTAKGALPHGILFLSASGGPDGTDHRAGAGLKEQRDYLRSKFFSEDHLKRYEKRPIYFPFSSEKRSYVAYCSIHRWHDSTLQVLLADYLVPERLRLLDIGTNMGFFLRKCVEAGYAAEGVEPSPSLSKIAREQFGLTITNSYFEAAGFAKGSFDVITMIDVFEHVTNPIELLGTARQVLADDGVLAIKVPNGNYNLLKQRIAERTKREAQYDIWDSYEHVVH